MVVKPSPWHRVLTPRGGTFVLRGAVAQGGTSRGRQGMRPRRDRIVSVTHLRRLQTMRQYGPLCLSEPDVARTNVPTHAYHNRKVQGSQSCHRRRVCRTHTPSPWQACDQACRLAPQAERRLPRPILSMNVSRSDIPVGSSPRRCSRYVSCRNVKQHSPRSLLLESGYLHPDAPKAQLLDFPL